MLESLQVLGLGPEGRPGRNRAAWVGDADRCLVLMGELGHVDDIRCIELNVVVELDPDVFAAVEKPLGGAASGPADQCILPDGAQIGLAI